MKKVILVVGTRPNFMKAAPLYREFKKSSVLPILVHTGQHYDYQMSEIFFKELRLPKPKHYLAVGSGSHAVQTAKIMTRFEKVLLEENPKMVIVFGDVNSTLAAALVAKKLLFPVAHVEAGLRSFDATMPEEINRILVDRISDYLFTPSPDADLNLIREGISKKNIYNVGNIMIDSLVSILKKTNDSKILNTNNLAGGKYVLVTLHRPQNVDNKANLSSIITDMEKLPEALKVVFPMHPRTEKNIKKMGIKISKRITVMKPLGYRDFVALEKSASLVITDSGGIQEETSFLNVPCLTIRPNTERPITISHGTNKLVNYQTLSNEIEKSMKAITKQKRAISLWDGKTAKRISRIILSKLN